MNNLLLQLSKLILVYQNNFFYAQKFHKQVNDQGIKLKNFAFNDKIWLNGKYIKIKQNLKLVIKFFGLF